MKNARIAGFALTAAFSLGVAQAQPPQVGQDMKNAGHDTANAGKTVGHDTAHGTKVAAHDTAHGTKVAAHKTSHVAKRGAHKTAHGTRTVAHKVEGKPNTPENNPH